jgi:hypothetical protein
MKRTVTSLIATSALLLAGCGSDESTSVPATAPTTSTTVTGEQSVLNDYRAFWDDYLAVTNPMTPGSPRIAAHSTGKELDQLNQVVIAGKAKGTAFKGTIDLSPKVESVTGDNAFVTDCSIDRTGEYSNIDGKRLDTEDLTPQNLRVELKRVGSVWKVLSIDHRSAPCTP